MAILKNQLVRLILGGIFGILIGYSDIHILVKLLITIKDSIKTILLFLIPIIILILILYSVLHLSYDIKILLICIFIISYLSTVIFGFMSASFNALFIDKLIDIDHTRIIIQNSPMESGNSIGKFFNLSLKPPIGINEALFIALLLASVISISKTKNNLSSITSLFNDLYELMEIIMKKFMLPLIPLFIAGFFAELAHARVLFNLIGAVYPILFINIFLHWCCILSQFGITGIIVGANPFLLLKNMMPAYITGVGTKSSVMSLPVTIQCMMKNNIPKSLANFTGSMCANIHMCGSLISIITNTFLILSIYNIDINYVNIIPYVLIVSLYIVAAPSVPGGTVILSSVYAQGYFGLTDQNIELLITLHAMQLGFCTACSITGDGAIALILNKIFKSNVDLNNQKK